MSDLTDAFVRLRPDSAPAVDQTVTAGGGSDLGESVHVRFTRCPWSSTWLWRPGSASLLRSCRFRRLVRRAVRLLPGVQSVTVNRHNVITVNVAATSFKSNRAIAKAVNWAMVAVGGWVSHCLVVGEAALKEPASPGGNEEEKG